ncbi:hypothetical protein TSAR_006136 [Trichomalopsis sarcophagae]|uniref:Uncharacterized protein n=1 Tax=Trichomalopsis sarcophagae TaxID=543379 RepID=A0A232ESV4_9HYME|nr:hypothetical protein TSAR_006136 [Trichomalopsis sarcophagae]
MPSTACSNNSIGSGQFAEKVQAVVRYITTCYNVTAQQQRLNTTRVQNDVELNSSSVARITREKMLVPESSFGRVKESLLTADTEGSLEDAGLESEIERTMSTSSTSSDKIAPDPKDEPEAEAEGEYSYQLMYR